MRMTVHLDPRGDVAGSANFSREMFWLHLGNMNSGGIGPICAQTINKELFVIDRLGGPTPT